MSVSIPDIDFSRSVLIESDNPLIPTSVFLVAGDRTLEFDRATFMRAVMDEFGLVDPLELAATMPAAGERSVEMLPEGCSGCPMAPVIMEMLAARA